MNLDELYSRASTGIIRFGICGPTLEEFNTCSNDNKHEPDFVIQDDVVLEKFIERTFNWNNSQLVLIGGRPGVGKTGFVSRIIRYATKANLIRNPVVFDMNILGLPATMPEVRQDADFIVVDYIQLFFKGDKSIFEAEQMLFELSERCACPVVVISELPLFENTCEDYVLRLSDVVNAGLTESIYDEIILLWDDKDTVTLRNKDGYRINVMKSDVFN